MRLTTLITAVLLCTSMNAIASAPASRLHHHYDRDASFGVRATWNAFNGFKTQAQIAQAEAATVLRLIRRETFKYLSMRIWILLLNHMPPRRGGI